MAVVRVRLFRNMPQLGLLTVQPRATATLPTNGALPPSWYGPTA